MMDRVKLILWLLMTFLAIGISIYALAFFATTTLGSPEFKQHFASIPLSARLHIIPGGIALLLGAFQFLPQLRSGWTNLHRYSGRLYVIAVLASAIGGFLLAWYAIRSPATRLGFATLSILWFYSGIMAFLAIRAGNIKLHQQWMIRSYALTLAGVTLRLQLYALGKWLGLSFDQAYDVVAWFSWLPNLIIAEWLFIQSPLPGAKRTAANPRENSQPTTN